MGACGAPLPEAFSIREDRPIEPSPDAWAQGADFLDQDGRRPRDRPMWAEPVATTTSSPKRTLVVLAAVMLLTGGGLAASFLARPSTAAMVSAAATATPTIMASTGPTKVQPAAPATGADAASEPSTLLDKNKNDGTNMAKIVNTVEQPVDLAQGHQSDTGRSRRARPGGGAQREWIPRASQSEDRAGAARRVRDSRCAGRERGAGPDRTSAGQPRFRHQNRVTDDVRRTASRWAAARRAAALIDRHRRLGQASNQDHDPRQRGQTRAQHQPGWVGSRAGADHGRDPEGQAGSEGRQSGQAQGRRRGSRGTGPTAPMRPLSRKQRRPRLAGQAITRSNSAPRPRKPRVRLRLHDSVRNLPENSAAPSRRFIKQPRPARRSIASGSATCRRRTPKRSVPRWRREAAAASWRGTNLVGGARRQLMLALICGCATLTLSGEERDFFADTQPWGLILFRRNVADPAQVAALCAAFRDAVGRPDAPVFIDQEGGRVQRASPATLAGLSSRGALRRRRGRPGGRDACGTPDRWTTSTRLASPRPALPCSTCERQAVTM